MSRMTSRTAAVLAALSAAIAPGVAAAAETVITVPSTPSGNSSRAAIATLSNLKTVSRWAYPQAEAIAHAKPSIRSRAVGRLRFLTEDGQAEVYLALRSYHKGRHSWIEVTLPGRPNGVTGWVQAGALSELHIVHDYLRVDRETLRATLFRNGRPIWSAPVGVGRPSLPTPAGHFYMREKLRAINGSLYGPYAIGTSAYAPTLTEWPGGGVVGIHGTNEPSLIPGRPSHGCVRLHNADITRLWHLVQIGTPIEIV